MRGLRGAWLAAIAVACAFIALPPAQAAESSSNWAGYVVRARPGEAITAVNGSWIVPKINSLPPGYSSSWIGIGYRPNDLIQIGTATSGVGATSYHAWYEMLPANETAVTSGCAGDTRCTVAQGDRMTGSVTNTGGNNWRLAMANYGKGATPKWTWSKTVTYVSTLSSAEFIFEAPTVGYVGVGAQTIPANAPGAKFLRGSSLVVNGATRSLVSAAPIRMFMNDPAFGFVRTATPSLLAADGHFQVCAYKRTCPNF